MSKANWDWAIVRIVNAESTSPTFDVSVLQYYRKDAGGGGGGGGGDDRRRLNWWEWGNPDTKNAPMITQMGIHEETGKPPLLFGLTQGHNFDGDNYQAGMLIWHVQLDPTTKNVPLNANCNLQHKKIEEAKSKMWVGMRQ